MKHERENRPGFDADARILNRDGNFNLRREGGAEAWFNDLYHTLLVVSWSGLLSLVACSYLLVNVLFAIGYVLCGTEALAGTSSNGVTGGFLDAFFFSVHTLATIGYGQMAPVGLAANFLVTLEALVGLIGLAVVTGLVFTRFSRPTARVEFSNVAVITLFNGIPSLILRIANNRRNQIINAEMQFLLIRDEKTSEGVPFRAFHDLALRRGHAPFFALTWTIVHPIYENSPLFGKTNEDLVAENAEILTFLTGIDDTFAQAVNSRFSYKPSEILWGKKFKDILTKTPDGKTRIDMEKFHAVE
jgi:inward rectifier potassium channel